MARFSIHSHAQLTNDVHAIKGTDAPNEKKNTKCLLGGWWVKIRADLPFPQHQIYDYLFSLKASGLRRHFFEEKKKQLKRLPGDKEKKFKSYNCVCNQERWKQTPALIRLHVFSFRLHPGGLLLLCVVKHTCKVSLSFLLLNMPLKKTGLRKRLFTITFSFIY